jgi:lipoprotein signal peptidase
MGARRSTGALLGMLACLIVYTAADLTSKQWALDHLSYARAGFQPPVCEADEDGYPELQRLPAPPQRAIAGVLDLHYAENCGAAFGMLRAAPGWLRALVFGAAGVGASVVLIAMFVRGAGGALFGAAVPLILSGAIGNLCDRVRHGFVIDFLQVDPSLFDYPTFNVADVAITVGVALMLIDGARKPVDSAAEVVEPSL